LWEVRIGGLLALMYGPEEKLVSRLKFLLRQRAEAPKALGYAPITAAFRSANICSIAGSALQERS